MKPCLCFLVVAVALMRPAVAHFWPPAHPFHTPVPNETIEPATYYANVVPNVAHPHPQQQVPAFLPNRFWKSDSAFLFRPFMTSAWNAAPEQRMPLHNPFMEQLISSAYRRPSFGNYLKDPGTEGFGKRRRRIRGMRGEINVKWAVMPIWRRDPKPDNNNDNNNNVPSEENLIQPNRELLSRGPNLWPNSMNTMHPVPPAEQQAAWNEVEDVQEKETKRERRQIGANWNPQPLLNRFLSNATGLFDNLGRQMTRQLQSSVSDASKAMNGMFTGVFSSMDSAVRRFINLNVSQLRPDKLFSQIAALTRPQ